MTKVITAIVAEFDIRRDVVYHNQSIQCQSGSVLSLRLLSIQGIVILDWNNVQPRQLCARHAISQCNRLDDKTVLCELMVNCVIVMGVPRASFTQCC
jgi:hypothetical protein